MAAPAQPQPAAGAQRRLQRRHHAADVALAIRLAGRGRANGRQAIGHDQQIEALAAAGRRARAGDQPPGQRPAGPFRFRRGFAVAHIAAAHGGQPGQERGRGRRIVELPAGMAAARRADEHRLIGRPDLAEHILVGQVIAQHQQAAAGGQLVAQPGHGQALADAARPHFDDFCPIQPLEPRHAGQPLIDDGVDFHQHGRAGKLRHLAIVDGDRPAFALDQRALEAGGDALQLLIQRLDVAGGQAGVALPGRAAPLPGPMLGHQPQVGHAGQQALQLLALAAADDDQPQAGQLVQLVQQVDQFGRALRIERRGGQGQKRAVKVAEDAQRRVAGQGIPVLAGDFVVGRGGGIGVKCCRAHPAIIARMGKQRRPAACRARVFQQSTALRNAGF